MIVRRPMRRGHERPLADAPTLSSAAERGARKNKNPAGSLRRGSGHKSLTMTYFHKRMFTIIGAKAFHGPVRDGKEWGHLAMVVRRNR